MIVSNEEGIRHVVRRVLDGYTLSVPETDIPVQLTLREAESGEAALEEISKAAPAILLLDHKLPGISDIKVLQEIASRKIETLTVMIAEYENTETAVKATREGAYDFLPKPFTPDELRSTIEKASTQVLLTRRTRKLADEKKRVRLNFIRLLGHELKAPLAAVEGYMDILEGRTLGADLSSYNKVISRTRLRLQQMQKLIADLLDMANIEARERLRHLTKINICELARQSLELVEPQAQPRNIRCWLTSDSEVSFTGDRSELEIILNNLVSNAVKYNRDNGEVEVSLSCADNILSIKVRDTGIGMTVEESSRLFEEFVRIKNEKTRNILGTGLGLSLVKKLVESYGGSVSVESAPGLGSTFSVKLPMAPI